MEPLRDYEIAVLRGMIDEYRSQREREAVYRSFWTTGKVLGATIAALVVLATQVLTLVYLVAAHHG